MVTNRLAAGSKSTRIVAGHYLSIMVPGPYLERTERADPIIVTWIIFLFCLCCVYRTFKYLVRVALGGGQCSDLEEQKDNKVEIVVSLFINI